MITASTTREMFKEGEIFEKSGYLRPVACVCPMCKPQSNMSVTDDDEDEDDDDEEDDDPEEEDDGIPLNETRTQDRPTS